MYAVIVSGGKQYQVAEGDILKLESLAGEVGATIQLGNVLMLGGDKLNLDKSALEKVTVSAKVLAHGRSKKIRIIKFNRRKHHMKSQGHRQNYTEVQITKIDAN